MNNLDIISYIASKTIGLDLVPSKGCDSLKEVLDKEKEYENKELLHLSTKKHELPEYYKGAKPYNPTKEEISIIIQCINQVIHPDNQLNNLNNYEIRINDDQNILVRTCHESWMCLAGREWLIDMKNKTAKLVCMS